MNDSVRIALPEPRIASVKLHNALNSVEQHSCQVYTYLLSDYSYSPQLIKKVKCQASKFLKGIPSEGCVPKRFSDSWVLYMQIEQWMTALFNTFNIWQPESWKVFLSDSKLNPIANWFIYRNHKCVVLYQSAVFKVGSRFSTFNSFGMRTYLGSSSRDDKPLIDISNEINISTIHPFPPGVVSLSRNKRGTILIDVIANRSTDVSLHNEKKLFPNTTVTVVSDQWVSVVKFFGRCISQFDINQIESHPSSEGQFLNYEMTSRTLQIGEQCNLYIGVVFSDKTYILLEDLSDKDYRLKVNLKEFTNGNLVTYKQEMYVILYGSSLCNKYIVGKGKIDFSSNLSFENITNTESEEEESDSLSIVIYSICVVEVLAVGITILSCVVTINLKRQRRISKSENYERQNERANHLNSHESHQDQDIPFLSAPDPIIQLNKPPIDGIISLESVIGLEHSSSTPLCFPQAGAALLTLSTHQTSSPQFNDAILEESNNMFTQESPSPHSQPQLCINRPYWSGRNYNYWSSCSSNYRHPNIYRVIDDQTATSEHTRQGQI